MQGVPNTEKAMSKDNHRVPIREQLNTQVAARASRILRDPNASRAQKAMAASVFPPADWKPTGNKK